MTLKRSPLKQGKGLVRSVSAFTEHRSALARVTALAPGEGLRRGKPLAAKSKRRRAEDAEWKRLDARVKARDGWTCRAAAVWPEIVCRGRLVSHHVNPTGMGHPRICALDALRQVCAAHHTGPGGIHNGGQGKARRLGLLRDDSDRYGDTSGGAA